VFEPATVVSERTVRVGKDSCGRYVLAVLALPLYKVWNGR